MSTGIGRLRGGTVTWRTLLGLLLVPLTAAGVLLWGLWNPTDRLDTVTAAVVNLDKPVTVDGQMVPLGRVLAASLIGSPKPTTDDDKQVNFKWELTDEQDASAGLKDGRYATVVTIPKNFSAAATSTAAAAKDPAKKAETANIDIQTSDRGRLLDTALSNIVTTTATSVLNEQLGSQFVGGVFVGMTELGKGIGSAADGATKLADGSHQLADGISQLADGGSALAGGASELAGGTAQLSTGVQQLAGAANQLSTGASGLAGGLHETADGARKNANGQVALSEGLNQYVGGINQVIDPLLPLGPEVKKRLTSLVEMIEAGTIPFPSEEEKAQALEALNKSIADIDALTAKVQEVRDGGTALAEGFAATSAGSVELADGLDALSGGANQLAGGVQQFSAGVGTMAGQVPQLASGASQLADGARASADGASQLADGAQQAADGTTGLANGLNEAAKGIPNFTKSESQELAKVATKPVKAKGASDQLFNASGVPLFAGIALWAGAFASFLVLAPLWRRTQTAARGVGFVTLRSALPAAGLGALQGGVVGAILPLLLGYDFGQWASFFGLALLSGIAFSLVNQGLSALLGGFGRFISFALLVVAFAIGVISTAPPLLQAIGDGSPVGALFAGFQAIAMGTAGAANAAFALVLWGLGGLALTAFAVARKRKRAEA